MTTHPDERLRAERLERLRTEIRAGRISYGELAELADLMEHIDPGDVELLEWAGVPEGATGSTVPCALCGEALFLTPDGWTTDTSEGGYECPTTEGAKHRPSGAVCSHCGLTLTSSLGEVNRHGYRKVVWSDAASGGDVCGWDGGNEPHVPIEVEHRFIVTVTAADPQLAMTVMVERLGFDEDYGFEYRLGYEPDNSDGAP